MTTEKEVLEYIKNNPGCRMRYMKGDRMVLISLLSEMKAGGKIYSVAFSDPANMEFYDRWYAAEH